MTKAQIDALNFIKMLAENAQRDIRSANPSQRNLDSAHDRLASIIESANAALIGEEQSA